MAARCPDGDLMMPEYGVTFLEALKAATGTPQWSHAAKPPAPVLSEPVDWPVPGTQNPLAPQVLDGLRFKPAGRSAETYRSGRPPASAVSCSRSRSWSCARPAPSTPSAPASSARPPHALEAQPRVDLGEAAPARAGRRRGARRSC